MKKMKKLTISIVTYNSKKIIANCLNSIPKDRNIEVVVVDNDSKDGCVEFIQKKYGHVKVIRKKNEGFGAGHNVSIRNSISEYVLVLNPDVILKKDNLDYLLKFMDANKDVGCVMPKIVYPNGKLQYLCKRRPTVFTLFLRRSPNIVQKFFKKRMDHYLMKDKDYDKVFRVPYISGCFMLMRRDVLKKVGLFDENFFMYFEDTDLSLRVNKVSKVVYCPGTIAIHDWEGGSRRSFRLLWINIKSMFYYFNKWGWKFF